MLHEDGSADVLVEVVLEVILQVPDAPIQNARLVAEMTIHLSTT